MNADFLTILFCATIFTGVIYLLDKLLWEPQRRHAGENKQPKVIEYSRSFFSVLLIVLSIRSFIGQLFVVPTGSLSPTILPKAFIIVNQFAYGLRLPLFETKVIPVSEPKTGDITLFHSPVVPRMDLIKRVVGTPGDKISYVNKVLTINGKPAKQQFVRYATDTDGKQTWTVKVMRENLNGVEHEIYVCPQDSSQCPGAASNSDFKNLLVPKGEYFMMGDNRDNSDDSRYWGFVPEKNIMGQGWRVLFSWNTDKHWFRGHQFWKAL